MRVPREVLKLTDHAIDRLRERGLSVDDLEHAYARRMGDFQPGTQIGSMTMVGPLPDGRGRVKIVVAADDDKRVLSAWTIDEGTR